MSLDTANLNLIYDRAESDETASAAIRKSYQTLGNWSGLTDAERAQLERGTLTYHTLNRVESAVKTLAAALTSAGYPVEVTPVLKGNAEKKLILDSSNFQSAPYLYASGVHDTTYSSNYISTIDFFPLYGEDVTVTANIALGADSGFLWYDGGKSFISGAVASAISGYTMSASPPSGAEYGKININATGITPSAITSVTVQLQTSTLEDREWQEGDVLYRPQWTTYLDNVQKLRDAYYTLAETGELPAPEDKLGYVGANTIEKILADIDLLISWMKSSYRRCGTFRAGNNAAHLPLKGSV